MAFHGNGRYSPSLSICLSLTRRCFGRRYIRGSRSVIGRDSRSRLPKIIVSCKHLIARVRSHPDFCYTNLFGPIFRSYNSRQPTPSPKFQNTFFLIQTGAHIQIMSKRSSSVPSKSIPRDTSQHLEIDDKIKYKPTSNGPIVDVHRRV